MSNDTAGSISRGVKAVLSSALNSAVDDYEILSYNAAYKVKVPKSKETERNIWTPKIIQQFFIEAERFSCIYISVFLTIFSTGLRRGESIGLRKCDVDLDNCMFHIRQQITPKGISEPKTDSSKRPVTFSSYLVPMLQAQIEHCVNDTDLIFKTSKGTPITPDNVTRAFRTIVRRLGLPKADVHGVRAMFASYAMNYGAPRVIQEMLGHSDSKITQEVYQRGSISAKADVSEKVAVGMGLPLNKI